MALFSTAFSSSEEAERSRKRRRPTESTAPGSCWLAVVATLAVIGSGHSVVGFTHPPRVNSKRTGSSLWSATATADRKQQQQQQDLSSANVCLERILRTLEDGETSTAGIGSSSSSLPPWLERYQEHQPTQPSVSIEELDELEMTLTASGFSSDDVREILQTMVFYTTTTSSFDDDDDDVSLLRGMIDYVQLILDERCHFESLVSQPGETEPDDVSSMMSQMHQEVFASKPVILAGIVHFAECMAAREAGVYDWLERSVQKQKHRRDAPKSRKPAASLSSLGLEEFQTSLLVPSTAAVCRYPPHLSPTAHKIAASAATIKRAEILANTVMGVGSTRRLSKEQAEKLQGLLLSSMDDWRALALRCIASLFRLEGILQQQQQLQSSPLSKDEDDDESFAPLFHGLRSPQVVHTAQEAILVYGTLAQRLGMYPLKAKIEERAFQILYQRQFRAVSSVYQQNGNAMQAIKSYLSTQIDALLRSDASLMAHIDDIQISSRVKEPYSFWKKLLKSQTKKKQKQHLLEGGSSTKTASNLSFAEVNDGIALRVILKAKKETPEEPDETTRAREKLLCYYVQHLIRRYWPGDQDRVKDYIQYPKPNGYQSLHYTAYLTYFTGEQFPFEVQVRSEEMHRIAEYGVAAHWDYKLASTTEEEDAKSTDRKAMFAIEAAAEVVEPSVNTDESESSPEAVDVVPITTIAELDAIPQPFTFDEVILEPSIVYNGPNSLISDKVDFQQVASQPEPKNKARRSSNQQFEYIDALVTAQKKLTQERVYVFVAGAASLSMDQGQLVILESGSSIRDALEYMQETVPEVFSQESKVLEVCGRESDDVREPCSSPPSEPRVWRNGQLAQLGDCIRNGDVLLMEL